MLEKLKGTGAVLLVIAFFLIAALISVLLIYGTLWVSATIYPWLVAINGFVLVALVLLLLPLAGFRKTRGFSGLGIVLGSYVFGLTLWVWALLLTFQIWGWFAVVIGLLIAGIGIVPIAMLATLFSGEWSLLGQLF